MTKEEQYILNILQGHLNEVEQRLQDLIVERECSVAALEKFKSMIKDE